MTLTQLSWMDNAFLLSESPRTPGHFAPVVIYDPASAPGGVVSFDDVVERVRARLSLDPTFRRSLVTLPLGLDQAYWVEDATFDIGNHVHHETVPAPGTWLQFTDLVGAIHSRPLDLRRPLWELTYLDGLGAMDGFPPGCFAVMFKIHHAAVDGASGVRMLTMLHDDGPDSAQEQLTDTWRPDPVPSTVRLLGRAAVHTVARPMAAARLLGGHAGGLGRSARTLRPGSLGRPKLPARLTRTRFNGKVSAEKVFDAFRFPIEDMKTIKNKVPGATINDAALAIVSGGLRTFLNGRGELPTTSLVAAVPVSTRSAEDADTGGNQISMLRTPLHTDIADPLARLVAIAASTKASKQAQQGVSAAVMQDLAQAMPGALLGAAMKTMGALPLQGPVMAHTGVTNVPGSREPIYLAGARGEWFTGCAPLWDGLTLMHSVGSYRDDFSFQITACRADLPRPAEYIDALRASYEELLMMDTA
jgi:diacylglycerol O-acyltransferase / wax synthase